VTCSAGGRPTGGQPTGGQPTGGQPAGGQPTGGQPAGAITAARTAATLVLGAVAQADSGNIVFISGLPVPARVVACTGALEVALHGWDVTQADSARRPIPASLALDLREVAPALLADSERRGLFAAPVPVAPDATPAERLLALAGRAPTRHPSGSTRPVG